MAQYDSADLLARTREALRLPTLDQPQIDTLLYRALEEAQVTWMARLAALVPEQNYGPPEAVVSSDGGFTFVLASEPLGGHMELKNGLTGGPLFPSTDWGAGDFVIEGQTLRIPLGRSRTFPAGVYARYVKAPGLLNAANEPVMRPTFCRLLLVYRAAGTYARNSEGRNPEPYWAEEKKLWSGDPRDPGDTGFLGTLKTQQFAGGVVAADYAGTDWWRNNPDLR